MPQVAGGPGGGYIPAMTTPPKTKPEQQPAAPAPAEPAAPAKRPEEIGGPPGPEPTRYGDWERGGRCVDF